ncbi:acyl-CoA dehydrogenase family protein [Streptomyces decoyicus]|uniref:hypothetical protein n=1 Tax=Streptomyces decoyicus TaxID=249567 RepID=UPI003806FEB6
MVAAAKSGTRNAAVDTAQFHAAYATAEAKLRSARAWAMEVWRGIEDTLDTGELTSTEQDTLLRLALNHATWTVQDVGQTVHPSAGTAAIRRGPIDRFLRDLGTGTQHITSSPTVLRNCGKWLSGAQPRAHWEFLDLMPCPPGRRVRTGTKGRQRTPGSRIHGACYDAAAWQRGQSRCAW